MGIILSVLVLLAALVLIGLAWTLPSIGNFQQRTIRAVLTSVISVAALSFIYVGNSFVNVGSDNIATFEKTVLSSPLQGGKIIAVNGEMGPQAWFMREGYFQHKPWVYLTHNSTEEPLTVIPEGRIGVLYARDGEPMGKDQFFADDWYDAYLLKLKEGEVPEYTREQYEVKMLDPTFFLTNGGVKGPQYTVLKPGKYAISPVLWQLTLAAATTIPAGHVGVVISKVGKIYEDIERSATGNKLATPLVPDGYIGVRKRVLTTGNYYFNPTAITVQQEDMRAQVWTYKGCYTPREVEVSVDQDGKIAQLQIVHAEIPRPENAADCAVAIKTKDKYTVYAELRMQVQPDPESIAGIVAGIGSIQQVEDKVVTPSVRSVLRNIGERYEAIDFIMQRSKIEAEFRKEMLSRMSSAGVPAKEVYLANVDVPPAVVVPGKIQELSTKMAAAYKEQDKTYMQLIKTNETKATADQQSVLVEGKIADQKADYLKDAREKAGIGERQYLIAIAEGNKAVKAVYGDEKAFQMQIIRDMFDLCKAQPTVCNNVPVVYSTGGGQGGDQTLESFAALNLQNIIKAGKQLASTPNTTK